MRMIDMGRMFHFNRTARAGVRKRATRLLLVKRRHSAQSRQRGAIGLQLKLINNARVT